MTSEARGDGRTVQYQNGGTALTSGQSVQLNSDNLVGIVISDIAANELGTLAVEGEFYMDKNNSLDVINQGGRVEITVTSGAETIAADAAGRHVVTVNSLAGDAKAWVKINEF